MLQQLPHGRAFNLPLTALACTVVLAVALPIAAATAGPSGSSAEGKMPVPSASATPSAASGRGAKGDPGSDTAHGHGRRDGGGTDAYGGAAPAASCGGELTSPQGLMAQTCVMTQDRETWARTYYRNTTGSPLRAALTLMRPDGSNVRAECAVPAAGEPGLCETPRERSRTSGPERGYGAKGEIGSADGKRLLLRSGSNSPANSTSWGGGESAHERTRSLATGDAPATGLLER